MIFNNQFTPSSKIKGGCIPNYSIQTGFPNANLQRGYLGPLDLSMGVDMEVLIPDDRNRLTKVRIKIEVEYDETKGYKIQRKLKSCFNQVLKTFGLREEK